MWKRVSVRLLKTTTQYVANAVWIGPLDRPSDRPTVRSTVRPTVRLSVRSSDRPSVRPSVRPSDRPSDRPNLFCSGKNQIFKSSFDALDRLYSPDRPRVVGAVLNNSFQKGNL